MFLRLIIYFKFVSVSDIDNESVESSNNGIYLAKRVLYNNNNNDSTTNSQIKATNNQFAQPLLVNTK